MVITHVGYLMLVTAFGPFGVYTATGGAEFGPTLPKGPMSPLKYMGATTGATQAARSIFVSYNSAVGG